MANDATGFWEVASCDLDGGEVRALVIGLVEQPVRMEVDPINGFLFWMTGDGLYRVDLDDVEGTDGVQVRVLRRRLIGCAV